MTGVAHLATGLYLKGKFPRAPLHLLILAAAAPDLIWAFLNLTSVPGRAPLEIARVARPFGYIGDLDLALEPYSHALLSTTLLGLALAAVAYVAFRRREVAVAVLLATVGHWMLDYLVHDADLLLWPFGERARVGPGLPLDPAHPGRGLNATAPLVGFALQSLVVIGSTVAFLRAFPVPHRRGRLWFSVVIAALVLAALPVFLHGGLTRMVTSTKLFVTMALVEKAIAWLVLAWLARKVVGRALTVSPLSAAAYEPVDDEALRTSVKNLLDTAALLAFGAAFTYLLQSMSDARALPATGIVSVSLAVIYLLLGRRLLMKNPSTLWPAILFALALGPLARAVWDAGSFAAPLAALELALGGVCLYLVRTMLKRDVLL